MFGKPTVGANQARARRATVRFLGGLAIAATFCGSAVAERASSDSHPAPVAPEPQFSWRSSAQLISPGAGADHLALKDPSIVRVNGKYHVFMTTAASNGWHMAHMSFSDWSEAASAPVTTLDLSGIGPGYRAAPQVFYFEPQKLWYLIYQAGPPFYSTTANIEDPLSWSEPKPFFTKTPDAITATTGTEAWLGSAASEQGPPGGRRGTDPAWGR